MAAAPASATHPLVLAAAPSSQGIHVTWTDTAPAATYLLERTGPDGTVQILLDGSTTEYMDTDLEQGTYTYMLTADRGTEQDQSNPTAALSWPGCLPWISLNPVGVFWQRSCYCPFPSELEPLEFLLCD